MQQYMRLPEDKDGLDEHIFQGELKEIRKEMQQMNTVNIHDTMGEQIHGIKKVHTREMSRLFRSKKEIYQIMLIEGQYYLPPIEECTIDFLRSIFSGEKKVSIPLPFL